MAVSNFFSIANIYVAYRKAKAEAFYENTHFHALAFTEYERNLDSNLRNLRLRLVAKSPDWFDDIGFIGDHGYLPKAVDPGIWDDSTAGHFRALDPSKDWQRRFDKVGKRANASLRLVIRPTVDFQIVSALWIIFVGHLFDASLDQGLSFGNRLRRSKTAIKDPRVNDRGVNLSTPGLFAPYFSAYRSWREGGLKSMETALEAGESILAITMDIEKFYHRVSPSFMLRPTFLEAINLSLSSAERKFTRQLLAAMATWYRLTPDYETRPSGAIPVGLSASKIISNVLLVEFDRAVNSKLSPIYYGRYVDDVFLVLRSSDEDFEAKSVTKRLAARLAPMLKVMRKEGEPDSLRLNFPYARDSELLFAGPKQKIFSLSSAHGSDLVHHIRHQIRVQSSEYRLLPLVPPTGIAMASKALLATPNAALQADALRKADVVSVRRLGFSLLLSDVETYAADLSPLSWQDIRNEFYGLINRHIITPCGFFDYFGYIPRIFGLMLSCGDVEDATRLINDLVKTAKLLRNTTTLGSPQDIDKFNLCLEQYAHALLQTGVQAATLRVVKLSGEYLRVLHKLRNICRAIKLPKSVQELTEVSNQVLRADWGRRPYKEYWFLDQREDEVGPEVPREISVRRQLRLGAIRRLRSNATDLKAPYWPALAFPTRPLQLDEIGLVAPAVFSNGELFRSMIRFLRGAEVVSPFLLGFTPAENPCTSYFLAPSPSKNIVRIAVTSVETTQAQWMAAAKGKQDRSMKRYVTLNGMINRILKDPKKPSYIIMPELSIPLRWALRAARKLAKNNVSLLAGVEYHRDRTTQRLRNDCLVSLTTNWPGYASGISILQTKFAAAHGERESLEAMLGKKGLLHKPSGNAAKPIVYEHGGFFFSILICSDLTNIAHRQILRGEIDALFAIEWNQDTKTFASLVESSANDLHAFVIQANNRSYGDSRIRAPTSEDYARDVVQVKGGISDYYVIGEVDFKRLRTEQRKKVKRPKYKPVPIGYVMSSGRSR